MRYLYPPPSSRKLKVLQNYLTTKQKWIEHTKSDQMAQQTKNRFAKRNQHCDVTKKRKSENNAILL